MKSIDEQMDLLKQLMDMLEQHFGVTSEIVLHDLTRDYEHTIVDIRNNHITGRSVGDCGSNLGLEVLRGTTKDGNRYNYITHTKDAKILRSSSMYFYDGDRVIGSLCINTDITDTLRYESYLHTFNNYSIENGEKQRKEVFASNVKQLLESLLAEGTELVGKAAPLMGKDDKMKFLEYLDAKGAFLISKSSDRVCEFLGVSRYTLYTYLENIREKNGKAHKKETEAE